MNKLLKWILIVIVVIIILILFSVFFVYKIQFKDVNEYEIPKFITHDVVNVSYISSITRFRSGIGHSNPGYPELCRSMKHYFSVTANDKNIMPNHERVIPPSEDYSLDIYSPVDGDISISPTGEGDMQVNIGVDNYPGYYIRLEHVYPNKNITTLTHVKAGDKIAVVWDDQTFDVSVDYHYYKGEKLYSYFFAVTDSVFQDYLDAGAKSRYDFVFSKEYRDAHTFECLNNSKDTPSFAQNYGTPDSSVYLNLDKINVTDFESCLKANPLEDAKTNCTTADGRIFVKQNPTSSVNNTDYLVSFNESIDEKNIIDFETCIKTYPKNLVNGTCTTPDGRVYEKE